MAEHDGRGRGRTIAGGFAVAVPALLAAWSGAGARAAERAVPQDGRLVEVDGSTLHVVELGEGPPVVMIHGLGGQLRNFSYALTDRLRGHRLILVDRPGSGYSRGAAGPMDIPAQAALVAGLIAQLGLDRPLVVGHSLGGAVALALALDHPAQVGALALVAPLTQVQGSIPSPLAAFARLPRTARLPFAWVMGSPAARLTGRRTMQHVFAPEPVPEDFPTRGGALLASRPGNVDAATFEVGTLDASLAAMVPRYRELALPVGILYAREDQVLDPSRDGELAKDQIAGAVLEMVDGGHMLPVTQPDLTARFIEAVAARQTRT